MTDPELIRKAMDNMDGEGFPESQQVNERERKIIGIVKLWRELVQASSIDIEIKTQLLGWIEKAGSILGKPNVGLQWDDMATKMYMLGWGVKDQTEKQEVEVLINELQIDMSRKHRELLEQ